MHLSPKEIDKLMLHNAGFLAQKRYARGLKLNYVETMALISAQILEFIRDGDSVIQLMEKGKGLLGLEDVLSGVAEMIQEIQVEGTFPDGTKLVTVHHPICRTRGDESLVLYGSGLKRVSRETQPRAMDPFVFLDQQAMPGALFSSEEEIILNEGREALELLVLNRGDRPVQVGSHYPFFETNPALEFDREAAYGKRLDIPAGTAVRFEPGETKKISLVDIAGQRISRGGNNLINGSLKDRRSDAIQRMTSGDFNNKEQLHG